MAQGDSDQDEELVECMDCGGTIAPGADPSFPFGTRGILCFECAIRRGGKYDAPKDRWLVSPDLAGLPVDAAEP